MLYRERAKCAGKLLFCLLLLNGLLQMSAGGAEPFNDLGIPNPYAGIPDFFASKPQNKPDPDDPGFDRSTLVPQVWHDAARWGQLRKGMTIEVVVGILGPATRTSASAKNGDVTEVYHWESLTFYRSSLGGYRYNKATKTFDRAPYGESNRFPFDSSVDISGQCAFKKSVFGAMKLDSWRFSRD